MDDLKPPMGNPAKIPSVKPEGEEEYEMEYGGIDPNLLLAKMGDGSDKQNEWWPLWLLLFSGFGRGGGYGFDSFGHQGVGHPSLGSTCCPPVTLEQLNDAQNALASQIAQGTDQTIERTMDITRDLGALDRRNADSFARVDGTIQNASSLNLLGQRDLQQQISNCCCETQKEIVGLRGDVDKECCETRNAINVQGLGTQNGLQQVINSVDRNACDTRAAIQQCCCETQNAIAMQTQQITQAICDDGQATRQLITQNKIDELQSQLTDAKLMNSNLSQTQVLQQSIRDACCQPCQPCHPHPWFMQGGGFVPPGQQNNG